MMEITRVQPDGWIGRTGGEKGVWHYLKTEVELLDFVRKNRGVS
jgi:hypothetical protein